jgi:hypothetical protein
LAGYDSEKNIAPESSYMDCPAVANTIGKQNNKQKTIKIIITLKIVK